MAAIGDLGLGSALVGAAVILLHLVVACFVQETGFVTFYFSPFSNPTISSMEEMDGEVEAKTTLCKGCEALTEALTCMNSKHEIEVSDLLAIISSQQKQIEELQRGLNEILEVTEIQGPVSQDHTEPDWETGNFTQDQQQDSELEAEQSNIEESQPTSNSSAKAEQNAAPTIEQETKSPTLPHPLPTSPNPPGTGSAKTKKKNAKKAEKRAQKSEEKRVQKAQEAQEAAESGLELVTTEQNPPGTGSKATKNNRARKKRRNAEKKEEAAAATFLVAAASEAYESDEKDSGDESDAATSGNGKEGLDRPQN